MRNLNLLLLALTLTLSCCNTTNKQQAIIQVDADSLLNNINDYNHKTIETKGFVAHVCGVNRQKLKLITADGQALKVVPSDSTECFDKSLTRKMIKIQGVAVENRIPRAQIEKLNKAKSLLCHVDQKPCIDSAWIKRQHKLNHAETILKRDFDKLNAKMNETGKAYISVVTVHLNHLEIIKPEGK